jgi:uncharacterized protein YqjF (DUF2071 family)
MQWLDLAFLHWPWQPQALHRLLPPSVELDLWEGQAWLGIVPFSMRGIRARGCPAFPGISSSLELNVRTYVRCGDRAGVWFFSLDAAHPLLVRGARATFSLPYFQARMSLGLRDGRTHFASNRTHRGAPLARFEARYLARGDAFQAAAGTLEHWLFERYSFFTVDARGRTFRCDVRHPPWTLRLAECDVAENDMGRLLHLPRFSPPTLCHAAGPLTVQATRLHSALDRPPLAGGRVTSVVCGNYKNIAASAESG